MEQLEFRPIRSTPRLTVSLSEKVNMGNYESKDVFVSISTDLPEDIDIFNDDLTEYYKKAFDTVQAELNTQIKNIKNGNTSTAEALKPAKASTFSKRFR